MSNEDRQWWICTNWLDNDGKKVLGPFVSRDLAVEVRDLYEFKHDRDDLFVDSEPVVS